MPLSAQPPSRLRAAGLPLALAILWLAADPAPGLPAETAAARPPNVVLFFIDTLRADRVHHLGYPRQTTPSLDRVAAGGASFRRAYSQATWSLPSYSSIFTSRYPPSTGVLSTADRLPADAPTLAEIFSACGYRTAAFTCGGHLAPGHGLERGFGIYRNRTFEVSLATTVPEAVDWLAGNESGPFFMLIHGLDAHAPYSPPLGFAELYEPSYRGPVHMPGFLRPEVLVDLEENRFDPELVMGTREGPGLESLTPGMVEALVPPPDPDAAPASTARPPPGRPPPGRPWTTSLWLGDAPPPGPGATGELGLPFRLPPRRVPLSQADVGHLRAHYDGAVTYADTWLGLFVEALEGAAVRERTLLVVAGDHGEELGEHGRFGHGGQVREVLLHVPLVIAGPGVARSRQVSQVVELVDLAPTLLELCGLPRSRTFQGRSQVPWLRPGEPPAPDESRAAFAAEVRMLSVRTNRWHLIRPLAEGQLPPGAAELYEPERDPAELRELSGRLPGEVRLLESRLTDWLEALPAPPPTAGASSGERERRARALFGYW